MVGKASKVLFGAVVLMSSVFWVFQCCASIEIISLDRVFPSPYNEVFLILWMLSLAHIGGAAGDAAEDSGDPPPGR